MTPMMDQYRKIKAQYADALLFYRLGDFYELFFEDALEASTLLQLTLTARHKGENQAPMCGVPYHAASGYISKLTKLGKKVAICEQLSDPTLPGIVQRDVIRIVTPGTTLDSNILEQKCHNYVMALIIRDEVFHLSYADITTGECLETSISSEAEFLAEFERIAPTELICSSELLQHPTLVKIRQTHPHAFIYPYEKVSSSASDMLMKYFQETQKGVLRHFQKPKAYEAKEFMPIDEVTLKNLELLSTLKENKKEGSLLWVLDETLTSMGGRMLRFFLTHPLCEKSQIESRLEVVKFFVTQQKIMTDVREILSSVLDLERLLARLSLRQGNARDLIGLKASLSVVPLLRKVLIEATPLLLRNTYESLDPMSDIVDLIGRAIVEDPPLSITDGGMIAEGYHAELDELKKLSRDGKSYIQKLQEQEIAATGIQTLKIRFNSVFGYYIEISKGQLKNVPLRYIRKQTLTNAERFITPELKEFEEKILSAEEKTVSLEQRLFEEIRERIVGEAARLQKTSQALALLDTLCSFAFVALHQRFCKPEIFTDGRLTVQSGRHPVVEKMNKTKGFIANDIQLDIQGKRLFLITGPNMGGKSTYLRQIAIITLMAHIGSFVPAEKAEIGLIDRIFTRVGASDNLALGQSTFMVEMQESAHILRHATEHSLIILDEIGRGTSTYDGMSIAWAITEYLHDAVRAKTLFATHYHELISLADKLPHAANYSVSVKEENGEVVFLYKILAGGVDRSYGIEVAKLAGLPSEIISKAQKILLDLEEGVLEPAIHQELSNSRERISEGQTVLFEEAGSLKGLKDTATVRLHEGLEALKKIDLNQITPLEALQELNKLKNKIEP